MGGANSLTLDDVANTVDVTTDDTGTATGIGGSFSNIADFTGGSDTDEFTLDGGTISGSVDGAGGVNTVNLDDNASTVEVTGADSGTATGIGTGFSNIGNFNGADGDDLFDLNGGTLSGAVDGGDGGNSITLNDGGRSIDVTGADSGTTADITGGFSNVGSFDGGSGDDTFAISSGSVSGSIDGQGGTDTLDNTTGTNTFDLTGANSGDVSDLAGGFSNVENLQGGDGEDTFNIASAGNLSGSIDGGELADTINQDDDGVTFSVTGTNSGTTDDITGGFSSVANLNGGGGDDNFDFYGGDITGSIDGEGGTNNLQLDDEANTVEINGPDSGTATSIGATFSDITNIAGGSDTDDFDINGGTLSGGIDGGAGNDSVTLDDNLNVAIVTGADEGSATGLGSGFTGVENLTGGSDDDVVVIGGGTLTGNVDGAGGNDQLQLDDVNNTVSVNGADTGTATGIGGTFSNVENIDGNDSDDSFTIASGGSLTGDINGMDGDDTLAQADGTNAFTVDGAGAGTVTDLGGTFSEIENLDGGSDDDTFTINADGSLEGHIDGMGGNDTLVQADGDNVFTIDGADTGTVTDVSGTFSNVENLTANAGEDAFLFGSGGSLSGNIDGGTGFDSITQTDGNNAWSVDAMNSGDVDDLGGTFSNVEDLIGGDGDDSFTIGTAGSLDGFIDGGDGNDTIIQTGPDDATFDISGPNSGDVSDVADGFSNVDAVKRVACPGLRRQRAVCGALPIEQRAARRRGDQV